MCIVSGCLPAWPQSRAQHTFDGLWLKEIVLHVLHALRLQRPLNGMWHILQYHSAFDIRESNFELRTLVANAAAYVHLHWFCLLRILYLLFDGVNAKPRFAAIASEGHIVVEVAEIRWAVSEPAKCALVRRPCFLKDSV